MSYDTMTLLDLKKMCKTRGLKVSGNKDEVIIRLMEADELTNPTYQSTTFSAPGNSMAGQMPVSPQVVYGRMTPSRNRGR
ncbi:MAG: SAP domain-containing protein [Candidatus Poseidoniaceae archaeon]|nr:SAP domain-containing protein [Candidatus Poseidoniaceae archaeon]MBL6896051.1 SAP domain-containing protein [Candidatus Poseidoniaceae archaeon]